MTKATETSKYQLVGSVQERRPFSSSTAPSNFNAIIIPKTGFPAVQHRSKSAFARSREDQTKPSLSERRTEAPVAVSQSFKKYDGDEKNNTNFSRLAIKVPSGNGDRDWRIRVSEDNEKRIEDMPEEEREQEKKEILERFGANVGDILRKAKEARERKSRDSTVENAEIRKEPLLDELQDSCPRSALKVPTPGTSRPSSRADRKLRFADVTPDDVYVYESAPPSPRKKPLALLSSSDDSDSSTVPVISLGDYKSSQLFPKPKELAADIEMRSEGELEPEEGTPEYIRRRYFPNQSALDPALDWIQSSQTHNEKADLEPSPSTLRFDLNGKVIPTSLHSTLPTHLGLHHHANGEHAGYTLDDVFLLSRSTVPAQRSSMLGVLARIASQLGRNARGDFANGIPELEGQEYPLRKRILAAGIEAMKERGGVGVMAIEVIWECLVRWDELQSIEGVELKEAPKSNQSSSTDDASGKPPSGDIFTSLPLGQYVFPHISDAFSSATLPQESLSQLVAILHRFAQHSNEIANTIVTTPNLIFNLFQTLILTPIPPTQSSSLPNPNALGLLCTLASASRENATALAAPADALLRFLVFIPSSSPYPPSLMTSLITMTLKLYTVLASYGIYSHIATTAAVQLSKLTEYVLSMDCNSQPLRRAWLELVQAWIVCATDPHKTTPPHEILWSQISAWSWGPDALTFRLRLTSEDSVVWVALWGCISAWLEGAYVNSVRAGESERDSVLRVTKPGFDHGLEKEVVTAAFKGLQHVLDELTADENPGIGETSLGKLRLLEGHADVLAASLRLWLACTPPLPQAGARLESPPFSLPFSQLADLSAKIVNHPLWTRLYSDRATSYAHVYCRSLSLFLTYYLRLSRRLPTTSDDLWLAQAFVVLCRIIPGDEDFGQRTVQELAKFVNSSTAASNPVMYPPLVQAIVEGGGMEVIMPFLLDAFRLKDDEVHLGSAHISPESIQRSTTQRLPPSYLARGKEYPLPLSKDWVFVPLDHLLRSGTSRVLNSLPSSWNGSEVGVVRATLFLSKIMWEVLSKHRLQEWTLSMAETAFGCMKVFMLEHEQHNEDSVEEISRDGVVEGLMKDLLKPFTATASSALAVSFPTSILGEESLEVVASRFLGPSTPFYQYYTDFVNLYDAISFGHPTFSQLLIMPISMMYPIDFRRYLWGDYGHVLRNVRTKPNEVLIQTGRVGGLSDYLWPVEEDAQVVGSYLRALVRQGALVEDGFMRWIAVHHVACNIWEDLSTSDDEPFSSFSSPEKDRKDARGEQDIENAAKLLKAVVDQGGFEVVRDVVRYVQSKKDGQPLLVPPTCFEDLGRRGEQRLALVGRVGGDALRERLRALLE